MDNITSTGIKSRDCLCGGSTVVFYLGDKRYAVSCEFCGIKREFDETSMDSAILNWNGNNGRIKYKAGLTHKFEAFNFDFEGHIFDTKEEAIKMAREELRIDNEELIDNMKTKTFYVCEAVEVKSSKLVSAEGILEDIGLGFYDTFGDIAEADNFSHELMLISNKKVEELDEKLKKVIDDFFSEVNITTNIYEFNNIEEVDVYE